jgi:ATP-binding cassette, subfamily B, bacterial
LQEAQVSGGSLCAAEVPVTASAADIFQGWVRVQGNSDNSTTPEPEPVSDSSGSVGALRLWTDGFRALGPDRIRLVGTGVLALASGILETALLYLIARLALVLTSDPGKVVVGGIGPIPEGQVTTGWIVGVACVLLVVLVALAVPLMHSMASLSTRSLVRTRSRLVHAYLGSSWSYRSSEREGHFAQMIGEYSQRTEQLVTQLGIVIVAACQILMLMTARSSPSPACSWPPSPCVPCRGACAPTPTRTPRTTATS